VPAEKGIKEMTVEEKAKAIVSSESISGPNRRKRLIKKIVKAIEEAERAGAEKMREAAATHVDDFPVQLNLNLVLAQGIREIGLPGDAFAGRVK